ncbi:MAG: cytochrome C [Bacteroidetes bacterium]|nr:cytochrome C [Bacteroidota bacterium]MCW5896895.1 cytochrome C [Bacteroidota bacterium]
MATKRIVPLLVLLVLRGIAYAQFSPGQLSRVHLDLEGMQNCLTCHETGKEISGQKCLACHEEIKSVIDAKRGYHFRVAAQRCVACHKEHLGRDAQTILFDKNTFDHAQTGFNRTGKHATIRCEDCHSTKNIKDPGILALVKQTGRETYLGLSQACAGCHADRHNATVGKECQTCHTTTSWRPAAFFNHAKTEFPLRGKHTTVACIGCHADFERAERETALLFSTKSFPDCAPCHRSPHSIDFVGKQACNSCHTDEGWGSARASNKFNHDLTPFRLVGKHASVQCDKCHKSATFPVPGQRLKLAHNACRDCHTDYHKGEFSARFESKCESCHTPFGFRPATYTIAAHNTARFPLTGAHVATPCEKCHAVGNDGRKTFRVPNIQCDGCHNDVHKGQFAVEMAGQNCAACHSTEDWFPNKFDHSKTRFALVGKHTQTKCASCHKPVRIGNAEIAQFKNTPSKCESCHKEVHMGQFAKNGETTCASCHEASGWKSLVFDHNTHSSFALTGGHSRVDCRQCHQEEQSSIGRFVRYKPLSTKCESCHTQGSMRQ